MSAYIVSRNHITYLITAYRQYRHPTEEELTELGNLLWRENIKSVQYRYDDRSLDQLPGTIGENYCYTYQGPSAIPFDPVTILKACHCFAYQSCEHPEWGESEACKVITDLKEEATRRLPGYDTAPWGIE